MFGGKGAKNKKQGELMKDKIKPKPIVKKPGKVKEKKKKKASSSSGRGRRPSAQDEPGDTDKKGPHKEDGKSSNVFKVT